AASVAAPQAIDQAPVVSVVGPGPRQPAQTMATAGLGDLPMGFEANQGQADASVKFLSRGSGYTLFLTADEAVLGLVTLPPPGAGTQASDPAPRVSVLRSRLIGAAPSPDVEGLDPLPGRSNYFVGDDPSKWHTDVTNYARVRYRGVYPGVD